MAPSGHSLKITGVSALEILSFRHNCWSYTHTSQAFPALTKMFEGGTSLIVALLKLCFAQSFWDWLAFYLCMLQACVFELPGLLLIH